MPDVLWVIVACLVIVIIQLGVLISNQRSYWSWVVEQLWVGMSRAAWHSRRGDRWDNARRDWVNDAHEKDEESLDR